jgi:transcription antitermination factor NusG
MERPDASGWRSLYSSPMCLSNWSREEDLTEVRMINGVVNFVYWLGKPAVVKNKEIEIIRKFLNDHDEVWTEPIALQKDARVVIRRGAFMDKEARVVKVTNNKVRVLIESIGYSLVAVVARVERGSSWKALDLYNQ